MTDESEGQDIVCRCVACAQEVFTDDCVPTDDGRFYHTYCYRTACIAAGMPDPYPTCDKCGQMIFGERATKDGSQLYEDGGWRDFRFHPECAPGPTVIPFDPTTDSVTNLAGQIEQHVINQGGVPTALTVRDHPECKHCAKRIARCLEARWDDDVKIWHYYHRSCLTKSTKPKRGAAAPKADKPPPSICVECTQPITRGGYQECDAPNGAGKIRYHNRCYDACYTAAGEKNPRLEALKEAKALKQAASATATCPLCEPPQEIPRLEYDEHVKAHMQPKASAAVPVGR